MNPFIEATNNGSEELSPRPTSRGGRGLAVSGDSNFGLVLEGLGFGSLGVWGLGVEGLGPLGIWGLSEVLRAFELTVGVLASAKGHPLARHPYGLGFRV